MERHRPRMRCVGNDTHERKVGREHVHRNWTRGGKLETWLDVQAHVRGGQRSWNLIQTGKLLSPATGITGTVRWLTKTTRKCAKVVHWTSLSLGFSIKVRRMPMSLRKPSPWQRMAHAALGKSISCDHASALNTKFPYTMHPIRLVVNQACHHAPFVSRTPGERNSQRLFSQTVPLVRRRFRPTIRMPTA